MSSNPISIAKNFSDELKSLRFRNAAFVYNPLDYAWAAHADYLQKYGQGTREVLFLGMNPGPWGMAQTGVPFGEVNFVKDWLNVSGEVKKPKSECTQKPVTGFACTRSEVSGKRFWGLAKTHFVIPQKFFSKFMVLNYCPLLFLEEGGRNLTPDKIGADDLKPLQAICDRALQKFIAHYKPRWLIGVGGFAKACFARVATDPKMQVASILHPSPASPKANRGWEQSAVAELKRLAVL